MKCTYQYVVENIGIHSNTFETNIVCCFYIRRLAVLGIASYHIEITQYYFFLT